jgi:PAS domain S-box-containing protein
MPSKFEDLVPTGDQLSQGTTSPLDRPGVAAQAAIALLYLVGGMVGLALRLPSSPATLAWPPAGLALGAMLLFGRSAIPGITLGAAGVCALDALLTPGVMPMAPRLAQSAATVAIAVLQAWTGSTLIHRLAPAPNHLDDAKRVGILLGLGGGVAGLLGAGLETAGTAVWLDRSGADVLFDGTCRWAGQMLSVALFTPLTLAWWTRRDANWKMRRAAITLCVVTTFAGAVLLIVYTSSQEYRHYQQELDSMAASLGASIENRITLYADAVASAQSLKSADPHIDRSSFELFAAHMHQRLPSFQALNWISHVTSAERPAFERGIDGYQPDHLGIKELDNGHWVPAGARSEYFPVEMTEPLPANRAAIGFDLGSDPIRRGAVERARDNGRMVFSPLFPLLTGGDGILAILPVYRSAQLPATAEERRDTFVGAAVGVFRPESLVADAFRPLAATDINFWLLNTRDALAQRVLAANNNRAPDLGRLVDQGLSDRRSTLISMQSVSAGDHNWVIQITPTPDFLTRFRQNTAWFIPLAGVAFTSLASAAVLVATGREVALRRSVDERAAALKEVESLTKLIRLEAENRLSAVIDNIGDAVIVIDDDGVIETMNKAAERTFGYAVEELAGQAIDRLLAIDEQDPASAPLSERIRTLADRGSTPIGALEAKRSDASLFPVEMTLSEARGVSGRRCIVIFHDMSHHTELEEELRASERRFRDLAGSASDWFWETDPSYRLTFVSERIGAILGVKAPEVIGLSYFDLGLDDDPELARRHRRTIADHEPFRDVVFHVGPQGTAQDSKYIRLSGIPMFENDGGFIGYRGIGADITRELAAERRAESLQRRYELILESAGEGIVGLDNDGIISFANRTAGTLLAMTPAEMVGQPFDQIVSRTPDGTNGAPAATPILAASRNGLARLVGSGLFCRSDDHLLPVDYLVAPIQDGETMIGGVMLFRDATLRLQYERSLADQQHELERQVAERTAELTREMDVRRHVENALRESRERHKRVTDNLFDGVIGVDRNGLILFVNPSARRLLEWNPEEGDVEGYPLDQILRLRTQDGDVPFEHSPWRQVILDQRPLRDDDAQFITRTGKVLLVAFACSMLPYTDHQHAAIISFRDIEVLKHAQREAIAASKLASVGQLAAGIAHEINTPVQYVGDNLHYVGASLAKVADLVEAGSILAEQAQDIAETRAAATRYRDLMRVAKIAALMREMGDAINESKDGVGQIGRIVLSMKEFSHPGTSSKTTTDINKALENTLTVSRNVWKHAAVVERRFDPDLPSVVCHVGEMNQVFLNLIVNAAQAVESSGKPLPGRIVVETRTLPGNRVEIRVADSGTGVADSIKDKIFDPFFTTKDVGKGTGQGLAICRDVVVTKHGGTLDVEGAMGEGATFVVTLPIGRADTDLHEDTTSREMGQ